MLLRGDRQSLLGLTLRLAEETGVEAGRLQLLLLELRQAIAARPDSALLDDFSLEDMRAAVAMNRAHGSPLKLEASGGIQLDNVRAIAETGVDFISVGSLTKHVRAVDLSMRVSA